VSTKRTGVRLFVMVLGCYLALTLVGLFLMVGGGLGPDVEATPLNRIGSAILGVLFFPLELIHARFFFGRPLPGSDWLWIIGVGTSWAAIATFGSSLVRRARRAHGASS
jgi:hypothetical protein